MAKKKLINLAKELDFNSEEQYFDYCIDSHINGRQQQCRNLFAAMSRQDQKYLIGYIEDSKIKEFYFNLL